jgi:hypothetical protein
MQRFTAEFNAKLDTKMAELEGRLMAKMAELEAKLIKWVFVVMLGNVALSVAANTLTNAFRALSAGAAGH